MADKPKLAVYWASSCGGCEIAIVNLHEKLLAVDEAFDLCFCPCLMDTKREEIEAMADGAIALTLFNGAIRTGENEEMARLLRAKSQTLVAFGSCASEGCIPALSNLSTRAEHFRSVYLEGPSLDNPAGIVPRTETRVPEGVLELPAFNERVRTLDAVVEVDYFIPGCPPEPHQIWNVVQAITSGQPLPPRGSLLGGGRSTVCEECGRKKEDKRVGRFYRTWEIIPDTENCLLEQGIVCMGIATRDGCGALCPRVNMPCTGCYGPPENVRHQGAKMISALGAILDIGPCKGLGEKELIAKADAILESIPDSAGTFCKYTLGRMR